MPQILYIVIPCYNEEKVLPETFSRVEALVKRLIASQKIDKSSKVLFVDDGSKDNTWKMIDDMSKSHENAEGLKLTRNKGQQNALLAGLMFAREHADMVVSMDADLQDDVDATEKMVDEYLGGCDIVYGVRSSRKKDTLFKRTTAQGYYKVMKNLGVDIVYNHADYRLMSKKALNALSLYKEVNLFLRGIVPLIGYKYSVVEYERGERFAGETKYPLKKMIAFAFDGITSFSVKPIRLITSIGFVIFIISILAMIYSLVSKIFFFTDIGWTSLICSIWMIGGIQLLSIGVIGEYVGKIYSETKGRPKYLIEKDTLSQ